MVDKSEKFHLLVRLGYASRGLVYILLGYLALSSTGKAAGGPQASFDFLQEIPFGTSVLYVVTIGLLAYAIYKFIAAMGDVERKGAEPKGIAQRIGYFASGLAHTTLAWTAFEFARGIKRASTGDGGDEAAATVLTWDLGSAVLGIVGLGFLLAAGFQARSAITAHFMRSVGAGAPASVCWLGRAGHGARAVVFAIIGWSLSRSAWFSNGAEVKGLGGALASLQDAGALYTVVAVGLLMFGVFSLIVARFRVIPHVDRDDLKPRFR